MYIYTRICMYVCRKTDIDWTEYNVHSACMHLYVIRAGSSNFKGFSLCLFFAIPLQQWSIMGLDGLFMIGREQHVSFLRHPSVFWDRTACLWQGHCLYYRFETISFWLWKESTT